MCITLHSDGVARPVQLPRDSTAIVTETVLGLPVAQRGGRGPLIRHGQPGQPGQPGQALLFMSTHGRSIRDSRII